MRNSLLLKTLLAGALACRFAPAADPPLIDNDQVRVIKVTDQPHVKGNPHDHKLNRVMIYLNPGAQQITTPAGGAPQMLKWRANEVRWSPATSTHMPEIMSNAPVTMVEIEIKKPGNPAKVAGGGALDPLKVAPKIYSLEFENDQVRVFRVHMGPKAQIPEHEHLLNRVVVYLTDQNGSMTTPDGKTDTAQHKAGEASWGAPVRHREANLMDKPFEAVVVELKN